MSVIRYLYLLTITSAKQECIDAHHAKQHQEVPTQRAHVTHIEVGKLLDAALRNNAEALKQREWNFH